MQTLSFPPPRSRDGRRQSGRSFTRATWKDSRTTCHGKASCGCTPEVKSPANSSPRTPTKADRSPPTRALRRRTGRRSEDWWHTTQARIRRNLLTPPSPSRKSPEALQITIDEVGELFEANRLTSFDLDGEERIPDWQLIKPALPEFGDPSSLLPGLDVLYAAAPHNRSSTQPR